MDDIYNGHSRTTVMKKVMILLSTLIFEGTQVPSTTSQQRLFVVFVVVVYDSR